MSARSFFSAIPAAPADPVFGIALAYKNDPVPEAQKVNLVVGAYRDSAGLPVVLPSVERAARLLSESETSSDGHHEYLPIDGLPAFRQGAAQVMFGDECMSLLAGRLYTTQAISGTGALRVCLDFVRRHLGERTVYYPQQTWPIHPNVCAEAGLPAKAYRYLATTGGTVRLDAEAMLADLTAAPEGSVILLHVCAHNPTGVDPTPAEWERIADVIAERRLLPFFDSAYQGFATGDLARDAHAVRAFARRGLEMFVAQSFAKNMGLYGERVGALHVVSNDPTGLDHMGQQLRRAIRSSYSNPPAYGARLAAAIFQDPALFAQWDEDIKLMSGRIAGLRQSLRSALEARQTPGDWSVITSQIGMFAYLGLSDAQCEVMMSKHHVYMAKNGRISVPGLNETNIAQVADAIHDVVTAASTRAAL
ncbi:hypothetical protein, variant [Fonticula alba]|uniref:Aspartate aminotransferase n=1 Tax=Fonticula alba TaxID=691883 RepID=A0A058ZEX1_FONAL|nr:hypothetical protein, variant [Fonticula alba]KCV72481.1 hypothetical protein, variant [Fonticula alba]|eukprot:XP_009492182.1 hypothetical protein, variant [Fonticula alba]